MSEVQPETERFSDTDRAANLKLMSAALVGALLYVVALIFIPEASPRAVPEPAPASPFWLATLFRLSHLLSLFPMQAAFCAFFIFLAVYKRRHPHAWLFASLAGFSLPYVLFHWFRD